MELCRNGKAPSSARVLDRGAWADCSTASRTPAKPCAMDERFGHKSGQRDSWNQLSRASSARSGRCSVLVGTVSGMNRSRSASWAKNGRALPQGPAGPGRAKSSHALVVTLVGVAIWRARRFSFLLSRFFKNRLDEHLGERVEPWADDLADGRCTHNSKKGRRRHRAAGRYAAAPPACARNNSAWRSFELCPPPSNLEGLDVNLTPLPGSGLAVGSCSS